MRPSRVTKLYNFPLGRCVFALQGVLERAKAVGAKEIIELAERALAAARRAMDMKMRMEAGYSSQFPPEATEMDVIVDRYLGGVAGYLDVQMRIYPDEPRGEAAEALLRALFPEGVAAIVHLPYIEEHAQVQSLLERARSEDLAEYVRLLPELPGMLERLRQRNDEYGALLHQVQDIPDSAEVRQAREACQDRLAEVMCLIIGLSPLRGPRGAEEREHLLEPILEQNEALRILHRRRRMPPDINPETGEEVPDGEDPARKASAGSDASEPATEPPEDAPAT